MTSTPRSRRSGRRARRCSRSRHPSRGATATARSATHRATSFASRRPEGSHRVADQNANASKLIDDRIKELGDWRGETLARVRDIIKQADPDVVEEWKWAKATSP